MGKRKRGYISSDNQDKPFPSNSFRDSKDTKRRTTVSTSSSQDSDKDEGENSTHTGRGRGKRAVSSIEREQSGTMIGNNTAIVEKVAKDALDVKSDSGMLTLNVDTIPSEQEEKNIVMEKGQKGKDTTENSESELSEVIDEAPPPRKRKKAKNRSTDRNSGKVSLDPKVRQSTRGGKNKADEKLSSQEVEIKRLQSWLIRCGIRKVWYKELALHPTAQAKIKHLKDMLKDASMEGRFSAEKANRIREQRELKADLEAVQEGAKMWGQTESEDSTEGRKPERGRRLARGLRNLDFLGSDDGEETE